MTEQSLTEAIRQVLARGAYAMSADEKPYESQAHAVAHAVERHITEHGDGFHTFAELYDHRHALFAVLAQRMDIHSWRARQHDDGTMFDGMFIAGIDIPGGRRISYHLPLSWWDVFDGLTTLDLAPPWDGHTSSDVVEALRDYAVSLIEINARLNEIVRAAGGEG